MGNKLLRIRLGLPESEPSPNAAWIERFGGRPREFIGEILGELGEGWYEDGWASWRAFVAALFAEPLTAVELAKFSACTGLDFPPAARQREAWVPVGRRGGKSRVLAMIAVYLAVCVDWTPYLAKGERGHIVVLAAQLKHAAAIMGYVKAALAVRGLAKLVKRGLTDVIELEGSVVIEVVTASISAVRSRTVIAALCDEIAFWRSDETSANPDTEILNALRPAMATIPDRMLLAASSPYARRGTLWDAYHRYYGKVEGPLIWKAPTQVMHPSVEQDFLDQEYERDPISAAAEYGAEFRSDVLAFVPREVVEAAVVSGRRELTSSDDLQYRAFVDPSGGISDSMTLAIAHREGDRGVLDALREVVPPFDPESVVGEFAELLRSYRVSEVVGDHYGGEWPRSRFRARGISYQLSERRKSDIYQDWLPLLNSGRSALLDVPRLVNQACALERKTARGGRDSIDHPPLAHDDVVNAAAGAIVLAAGERYPAVWSPSDLPRIN